MLLREIDHFGGTTDMQTDPKEQERKETIVRVYDKRTTRDSSWVGLVLRQIPRTSREQEDIRKSFNASLGVNQAPDKHDVIPIDLGDIYQP